MDIMTVNIPDFGDIIDEAVENDEFGFSSYEHEFPWHPVSHLRYLSRYNGPHYFGGNRIPESLVGVVDTVKKVVIPEDVDTVADSITYGFSCLPMRAADNRVFVVIGSYTYCIFKQSVGFDVPTTHGAVSLVDAGEFYWVDCYSPDVGDHLGFCLVSFSVRNKDWQKVKEHVRSVQVIEEVDDYIAELVEDGTYEEV